MFTIHTLLKRGSSHKDFCEDFLCLHSDNEHIIGAIFDGCSSGKDSHFASVLYTKAMNKAYKSAIFAGNTPAEIIKSILKSTIAEVSQIKKNLELETNELLTTILLVVVDIKNELTEIVSIGDGFIMINGTDYLIDQDNRPDYASYYLDKLSDIEYFNYWFEQLDKFSATAINDISIASDGILTFQKNGILADTDKMNINPTDYLLKDTYLIKNRSMLRRKCNILKNKHSLENYDDISIIRIFRQNDNS